MNLCLFFEGTGQGVAGKFTNVTRLYSLCGEGVRQQRHLESGPGTHFGSYVTGIVHGSDWRRIFASARRWFEANYQSLPATDAVEGGKASPPTTRIFLFGFSRGALIARHFAAWLDKLGHPVAYLGLWDTVDSTIGLEVDEVCPANVSIARHAVSRDEKRRFFALVPLRSDAGDDLRVQERIFPGVHSDVGGLYEDDHTIADAALAWIADGATSAGVWLTKQPRSVSEDELARARRHESHTDVTNVYGFLGEVKRNFAQDALHKKLFAPSDF